MTKALTVSVIIPTYNRSGYICSAIDSVLNQKNVKARLEIIVVDDGSTDNTEAVLKKYKNKVRYFRIDHSGLPAVARNFGISKSSGDLIAFQDSDDIWALDKLSLQLPLFDNPDVVMSCGNASVIDDSGKTIKKLMGTREDLKGAENFSSLIKQNAVATLTTIIRKQVLDEVGPFNESTELRAVEDYELWLRISAKYPGGIKSLYSPLALYRSHDDNISQADTFLAIQRLINVYDSVWKSNILSHSQKQLLETELENMHANWSRTKTATGDIPAISIVMSIYNAEDFLHAAVKSILEQTLTSYEFLIIDDGCTDSSVEIVNKIKDDRIRIIHQTNHGLVAALNKGVSLARSQYIARMDADDISLPSRLEKEFAWISADEKRGLVGSFFTYINERTSSPTSTTLITPTKHIDLVRMMYLVNPFAHGSTIIRKQAIIDAGGYRDKYGPTEDYDLWRRIATNWEVGQVPEVLYWYRLNPAGISQSKQKIQHTYTKEIITELWQAPLAKKKFRSIISDAKYYKNSNENYGQLMYNQYVHQQVRLAFEFLVHGKLWTGYINAVAAFFLHPKAAVRLYKTLAWAPIKLFVNKLK